MPAGAVSAEAGGKQPIKVHLLHSLCADSAVAEAIAAAQGVLAAKNCGAGSLPQGTAMNLATNGRRLMQGGQRHCCHPSCLPHLELTSCGGANEHQPSVKRSVPRSILDHFTLM